MADLVGAVLERKRGDTAPDRIVVTESDGTTPRDVTGFSFTMTLNTLKAPPDNTTEVAQISGSLTDPVNGVVDFNWSALNADQTPGTYYYDIEQVDGGGKVLTIAKQKYKIYQDVTKVN